MPRAIRLKEFPQNTEIVNTPPDWYVAARDPSLVQQPYRIKTDDNGFILPEPLGKQNCPVIIFLGDSVLEGMFSLPEDRICSRTQALLEREKGLDVVILNSGYSGATALHSFNTFMNKIIPLRPSVVVLMTGMIDFDVALAKASFWSRDCWVEPIIEIGKDSQFRDEEKWSEPCFENQARLMTMFAAASRIFELPVWFTTLAHRQIFAGPYVEKAFKNRDDFGREVNRRRAVNEVTRQTALRNNIPLFDLERDLADRNDIFYDMYHLNAVGGEAVAQSLLKYGFAELLQNLIRGMKSGTQA
jgi:hypothetical protein